MLACCSSWCSIWIVVVWLCMVVEVLMDDTCISMETVNVLYLIQWTIYHDNGLDATSWCWSVSVTGNNVVAVDDNEVSDIPPNPARV